MLGLPAAGPDAGGVDDGRNGFDFLIGDWTVRHERLRDPLEPQEDWYEQTGTASSRTAFDGAVSIDEMHFPEAGERGMAVRLYEPDTGCWRIYWVSSRDGRLQAPVSGRWDDGVFTGTGPDEFAGTMILARYRWSAITATEARWEQAFSVDDGANWRTNWIMHWSRAEEVTP
jgi:hypothetical protein